ncbi:MAG: TetR/AcrR family transcriptional regulator [Opitutae bacterium]|nr:TetR/AcrR family transcriptional regulator [Opitutae bacterium]
MNRRPLKRSRAETQAETRRLLLDAAAQMFARRGYHGVSIDEVAEAAGYSKGAVYANFDSKQDLLLQLLGEHMEAKLQSLEAALLPAGIEGPRLDHLEQWLGATNAVADWPLLALELQLHARRDRRFGMRADRLFEEHRARLAELIGRFFAAAGRKPPVPVAELARGCSALAEGLACQSGLGDPAKSPAGRLLAAWMGALLETAPKVGAKPGG